MLTHMSTHFANVFQILFVYILYLILFVHTNTFLTTHLKKLSVPLFS